MAISYGDSKYVKGKGYTDAKSGKVIQKTSNSTPKRSSSSSSSKASTPSYDKNINYSQAIEKAIAEGKSQSYINNLATQRDAKIAGEKMTGVPTTKSLLGGTYNNAMNNYTGLGQQIINDTAGKVKVGKTFDEVMPWESFYNEGLQRDKVTQDYQPEYQRALDTTTKSKIYNTDSLLTDLGARGLSGGGGTALYKQRLLNDDFTQKFKDLETKKNDDLATTMQKIYNDTLNMYNNKKLDYNKKNYITY